MPEGDTVWLAGQRLHRALAGEVLTRSDFRVPQLATTDLTGRRVLEVVPRGKHLLTRLCQGLTLHTHFRMEGSWRLGPTGSMRPSPAVRIILSTATTDAFGVRIPVIDLGPTADEHLWVGHLGPDVLGPDWSVEQVLDNLRQTPDRMIGDALLDQSVLAGPGNLYRTEALFLHGVPPQRAVSEVKDLRGLIERVHRLMRANRDRGEQTTTGLPGRGQAHWVFQRKGCLRCHGRVREVMMGPSGQERRTAWCPHCQP